MAKRSADNIENKNSTCIRLCEEQYRRDLGITKRYYAKSKNVEERVEDGGRDGVESNN